MSTAIEETTEQTAPEQTAPAPPAPAVYHTRAGFRYPPHIKPSKGSGLRIHANGSITYHNPNFAPAAAPFKLHQLRPRTDGDLKTFDRLKEAIERREAGARARYRDAYKPQNVAGGFQMVATDGHTALLIQGSAAAEYSPIFDDHFPELRHVCTITDPEFHLAVKRAAVMTDQTAPAVRLIGTPGKLTLTSAVPGVGDFEETLASDTAAPWYVALDVKYLENVCGAWPLKVLAGGPDKLTVFEFGNGLFRYVVAPYKDGWDSAGFTPAEIEQTEPAEISNGPDQNKIQEETCVF